MCYNKPIVYVSCRKLYLFCKNNYSEVVDIKECYYFSHDSNAKDDPKCVMLIEQLGLEGFGIYWVLVELLRDQPTYKYPLSLIPAIARRYNTTAEKMKIVVTGYGLFEVDDSEFFSVSLMKRMGKMDAIKQKRSEAGKVSAQKRLLLNEKSTSVEQVLNMITTSVEQVKESKVKEKKVNIVNDYTDNKELISVINSFVEMRKCGNSKFTEYALKLILNKLTRLAGNNENLKIEILNQSIMCGWKDVFELKQQKLFNKQPEERRELPEY